MQIDKQTEPATAPDDKQRSFDGSGQSALASYALLALETALNAASKLDPATAQKLASLEGKSLGLFCQDPKISAVIQFGKTHQVLNSIPIDDPMIAASLNGNSQAWFTLIQSEDKAAALINSDLQLRGDSQLFQTFATIMSEIEIDWESLIADYIGDVPTHIGASALRYSQGRLKQQSENWQQRLEEYFNSERSPYINQHQSNTLYKELRQLEDRIDRITMRLKKMSDS